MMRRLRSFSAALAVVALSVSGLAACSSSDDGGGNTITIGVTDENDAWQKFVEKAEDAGHKIKTVTFTDYNQANPALSQKQLDLNFFQHLQYLADYNVNNDDNLQPISSVYIVPLGLYSKKHSKLDEIPRGGTVTIPNDTTNQGRALNVLAAAKLITLTKSAGLPTPDDIDKSASKIEVKPISAEQTALSLDSVDGAVINNTFIERANINPDSALFKDDPADPRAEPYINVFVARDEDKNNKELLEVAQIYNDPEVQALAKKESGGTQVSVTRTPAQLQQILADIEKQLRAK